MHGSEMLCVVQMSEYYRPSFLNPTVACVLFLSGISPSHSFSDIVNSGLAHPTASVYKPRASGARSRRQCPFEWIDFSDDKGASAPIYSDSRLLPWSANVELVSGAFRAAAEVLDEDGRDFNDKEARRESLPEVERRLLQHVRPLNWRTLAVRCTTAGVLAMLLHWGSIGSAIVYSVINSPKFSFW